MMRNPDHDMMLEMVSVTRAYMRAITLGRGIRESEHEVWDTIARVQRHIEQAEASACAIQHEQDNDAPSTALNAHYGQRG